MHFMLPEPVAQISRHLYHLCTDPNMKPGQETLCSHLVLSVLGLSWLSETLTWHSV